MNFNTVKFMLNNLTSNDTIQINYYGAIPVEYDLKHINYSFNYGSLIIEDLIHNEVRAISINTIKSIKTFKTNNLDGLDLEAGAKING